MDETEIQLIKEQLSRLRDQIDAHLDKIETRINHTCALNDERAKHIREDLTDIKSAVKDHEARIRSAHDIATSLTTRASIQQAGQVALTLVASAIAAWLGTQK